MRWHEWREDVRDRLQHLGRGHLTGIAAEVGAVLALLGAACVLALLAAGGRF